MRALGTWGEPSEIKNNTRPENITAFLPGLDGADVGEHELQPVVQLIVSRLLR